jgi:hypothetical protein
MHIPSNNHRPKSDYFQEEKGNGCWRIILFIAIPLLMFGTMLYFAR